MFMGMVIKGPGPLCLPLLDFMKCMSLHFTWSVLSPHSQSQLCADSKANFTICVASSLEYAEVDIDLLST